MHCKNYSHFCSKNINVFENTLATIIVKEFDIFELVKLTSLWTTRPRNSHNTEYSLPMTPRGRASKQTMTHCTTTSDQIKTRLLAPSSLSITKQISIHKNNTKFNNVDSTLIQRLDLESILNRCCTQHWNNVGSTMIQRLDWINIESMLHTTLKQCRFNVDSMLF